MIIVIFFHKHCPEISKTEPLIIRGRAVITMRSVESRVDNVPIKHGRDGYDFRQIWANE